MSALILIFYEKFWEIIIFLYGILIFKMVFILEGFVLNVIFECDVFSIYFVILRLLIVLIIVVASFTFLKYFNSWVDFNVVLFFLLLLLFFRFSFSSLFLFYIRFEFVVIPTFFLILGWGYRVERFQARLYILFYTLVASLPFLFLLIEVYYMLDTFFFFFFYYYLFFLDSYWWLFISLVFLVKLPVFLLHIWLPKAHVEAPLAGSMILAGVLLKLGGYGFFKSFFFLRNSFLVSKFLLIRLGLLGGLYISFMCLRQGDLKCLIAYSSVVHIGPILSLIICFRWLGWIGSFYIMLAHGICSSGLFYGLNLVYEKLYRRSILILKGGLMRYPVYSYFWFSLCAGNISCPPSFNFLSEVKMMFFF